MKGVHGNKMLYSEALLIYQFSNLVFVMRICVHLFWNYLKDVKCEAVLACRILLHYCGNKLYELYSLTQTPMAHSCLSTCPTPPSTQ